MAGLVENWWTVGLAYSKSESDQGAVSGLGGLSVPVRVQPLNPDGTLFLGQLEAKASKVRYGLFVYRLEPS